MEKKRKVEVDRDEKSKAIKELEKMVKLLRKENEDLKADGKQFENMKIELINSNEKAEKRKIVSDNLAKEVCKKSKTNFVNKIVLICHHVQCFSKF